MKASTGYPQARPAPAASPWATHAERGSQLMLRVMSWISLRLGRRLSRSVLYGIAVYFFLFAPRARRHAREYLRRVLGRPATPIDRFRQILAFASTIHDRVYLLNGCFDLFDISIDGEALVRAAGAAGGGALLIGAHLGSFEVTRALGQRQPGLEIAMAMYADNARKINAALTAISPRLKTDIIELGHMSAMLEIRARLAAGTFVGMMGDRTLGDEPVEQVMFLGARAPFPLGPLRAAAMLRLPVYFMGGFYLGGNRYHIVFEQIADFSTPGPGAGANAVSAAVRQYVALVERYCRLYPYNWFNFQDFWQLQLVGALPQSRSA
jgi:predicted LPLAT superfamily acyltransferase